MCDMTIATTPLASCRRTWRVPSPLLTSKLKNEYERTCMSCDVALVVC